jgi:ADP-heptose:LPS heptosyltransferase
MDAPERIAIVRLGAIGDAVNVLPFVCRLRDGWPRARITWVIGPLAHAAVRGHRAVDEFLVLDVRRPAAWPRAVRELRARRFDLAIDLQRILKSGIVTRLTGAPVRLGFDRARCKESSHRFTNRRIPPNPAPGVTVAQYLEFADFLGLPPQAPRWDLPYEPCAEPAPGERRVVVHVGATKPANRWDAARWGELVARLVREEGVRVHLTGGAGERATIDAVKRAAGVDIADEAGRLSLQQTAGLIRSARLFVGGDTGPLHMAVALGTPVVALFGAADPARTGPFGQAAWVVTNPVPCSPCRRRTCNVAGHPCMSGLEVEAVLARARARLCGSA